MPRWSGRCWAERSYTALPRDRQLRLFHESTPVPIGSCPRVPADQIRAGRQRRQPHIGEILRGVVGFDNASRRAPYGADSQAFAREAVGS